MATQTNPRIQEIQAIWNQYQGLYVIGGVFIGLMLFPFLELAITDLSELLIGLVPEAIGIGFTVFFLDRIYQKREIETVKRRLVREARSHSNDTAVSAIEQLGYEGWLTGENGLLKKGNLMNANLESIALWHVNFNGISLEQANLKNASFINVNLENARIRHTNLEEVIFTASNLKSAEFMYSNLKRADLRQTNLKNANFVGANLENAIFRYADLTDAYLRRANVQDANFEGATLPDGTKWALDTDMERFTDPEHPDFWQPNKTNI